MGPRLDAIHAAPHAATVKTVNLVLLALAGLSLGGCATSTVEKRARERHAAYAALPAEQRAAVDAGKIQTGLDMDAVYIAWGRPQQIVQLESARGTTINWLYHGSRLVGHHYWSYRGYGWGGRYCGGPMLDYDYLPFPYVRAEVVFDQGVVQDWETFPPPPGY